MIVESVRRILRTALVVYIIVVTVAAAGGIWLLSRKAGEIRRLESNQESLMVDVETYRTESGLNAARADRLQLTVEEYKTALRESEGTVASQKKVINDLGVKIRRLQSVSQSVAVTGVDTTVPFIRDTLPLTRTELSAVPVCSGLIEWRDPWVSLKVKVEGDGAQVQLRSVDTLYQIVHRVPKRFLCIPFGTKGIRQEIICSNPHTVLVYTEYIEFTDKRGRRRK